MTELILTLGDSRLKLLNRVVACIQAFVSVAFVIPFMINQVGKFLGWVTIALLFPLAISIAFSILPFYDYRKKYRLVRKLFIGMVIMVAVSAFIVYFAFSPYRIFLFFFFFVYLITIIRMEKDSIGWIILATNLLIFLAQLRFFLTEANGKLYLPLFN